MSDGLPLLGFGLPVSGSWATPATMIRVAQQAEGLGWDSLWTFQRLLVPAGPDAGEVQDPAARAADDPAYRSVHDAVLPLAYVAGHTGRIGLGTATLCAPFVAPVVLAKAMATLDHLTAGRLTVGLGLGWSRLEYAAAGVPFERRGARMEDYLRCLVALWADDPVEHDGEFYPVPRSHLGIEPVQRPHPPVLVGGAAPSALRRAGRLADGWIGSTGADLDTVPGSVALVRGGAAAAGRDPDGVRVLLRAVVELVDRDPGPGRRPFHGTRDQVLDDLARARSLGATEVLVDLNFSPRVGSPDVEPREATAYAEQVLDALRPPRPSA